MVGDSLTQGTLPYPGRCVRERRLGDLDDRRIHQSRRSNEGKRDKHTGLTSVDAIREKSGDSDLWVIALGTNDAGLYKRDKSRRSSTR